MTKYFTKNESNNILALLKSEDKESALLGFSLLKNHPKYKNFKKLIPYNEMRRFYIKSGLRTKKNCVSQEIKTLIGFINEDDYEFYLSEVRYLIKFITKRTKNYG